MMSKEWKEKKVTVEFWGELLRSSNISSSTVTDGGTKNNSYLIGVRRASLKKQFDLGDHRFTVIFGIHELPHVYSQWQGYWNWRYIDKSPLESLGFSAAPADLGLSGLYKYKILSAHVAVVNGEGYRNIQNANSTGYDLTGRVSIEPEFSNGVKSGLHFLARGGNLLGIAGNECIEQEGKNTPCINSDNNTNTRLVRDLRFQKSETFAAEWNLLYKQFVNIGIGGMFRKQFKGRTFDLLNLNNLPTFQRDTVGKAGYGWLALSYSDFTFYVKETIATCANQCENAVMEATQSASYDPINRVNTTATGFRNPAYQSRGYFVKKDFALEYNYTQTARFAIGYYELVAYDTNGAPAKAYLTYLGDTTTQTAFQNQFINQKYLGISEYFQKDKQLFIKSTFEF
jgi:hypothetical protein